MWEKFYQTSISYSKAYGKNDMDALFNNEKYKEYQQMMSVINDMSITDFPVEYLKIENPFPPNTVNIVAFLENMNLGFGFFFLTKGTFIQLHDHPAMTVNEKCLHGSIYRQALDLKNMDDYFIEFDPTYDFDTKVFDAVIKYE
jgi:hypothetical protein